MQFLKQLAARSRKTGDVRWIPISFVTATAYVCSVITLKSLLERQADFSICIDGNVFNYYSIIKLWSASFIEMKIKLN